MHHITRCSPGITWLAGSAWDVENAPSLCLHCSVCLVALAQSLPDVTWLPTCAQHIELILPLIVPSGLLHMLSISHIGFISVCVPCHIDASDVFSLSPNTTPPPFLFVLFTGAPIFNRCSWCQLLQHRHEFFPRHKPYTASRQNSISTTTSGCGPTTRIQIKLSLQDLMFQNNTEYYRCSNGLLNINLNHLTF